jgi:hypothetical protein
LSMAMNRKYKKWKHAKSCHSHEQGPVKPISKLV